MDPLFLLAAAAAGLAAGWFLARQAAAKVFAHQQARLTQAEGDLAALRARELALTPALARVESERDAARDAAAQADARAAEAAARDHDAREKLAAATAAQSALERDLAAADTRHRQRLAELADALALAKQAEQEARLALDQTLRELATAKAAEARFRTEAAEKDKAIAELRAAHDRELLAQREQKDADLAALKARQDEALKAMTESFKVLSADTLKAQLPEMLKGAEVLFQNFKTAAEGDFKTRQTALDGLLAPLKESLESYRTQIREGERLAGERLGEVKTLVETLAAANKTLADETGQFRQVLKSSQARGRWGEIMLERVFEAAGMKRDTHYTVQDTSGGDNRPDMIVKLPQGREVIIDSKVPDFDPIGELCQTDDPDRRAALCKEFAQKLRATAKALAARNYPATYPNALGHVILFLPAESLFAAALEGDRDIVLALDKERILLATPASLLAMIHAVLIGWRQHNQEENARRIADAAATLYERCVTLAAHWDRVGKGLRTAADAYNDAASSYTSRLLPAGKTLRALDIKAPKELPDLGLVDFTDKSRLLPDSPA